MWESIRVYRFVGAGMKPATWYRFVGTEQCRHMHLRGCKTLPAKIGWHYRCLSKMACIGRGDMHLSEVSSRFPWSSLCTVLDSESNMNGRMMYR